jgi:hypothetical protein
MYIIKIWKNLSYLNNKNASCFPGSRFQTFGVGVESRQWQLLFNLHSFNISYSLSLFFHLNSIYQIPSLNVWNLSKLMRSKNTSCEVMYIILLCLQLVSTLFYLYQAYKCIITETKPSMNENKEIKDIQ